jgi:fermentation-respiration switch protein FrsA (DUF1100 family)
MRALIAFGAAAVLVAILLYAYTTYLRRTSMFYPDRYPLGMWDTSGYAIAPEDVFFTTSDGVRLHGWIFRARVAGAPLIVWFHGNAGNITGRGPVAAELAQRGISVLLFDWRGYGKSEGSPTEEALLHDSEAAYQFATWQANPRDIVLYGESLGGPFAAYIAKGRAARCVVIENSFSSLRALGNALYAPLPLGWLALDALPTARWLNTARLPVLVMHGRQDEVIPFALGKQLFEDLRVPKEMLVSDSAGHSGIPAAEGSRYFATVERFIAASRTSSPGG